MRAGGRVLLIVVLGGAGWLLTVLLGKAGVSPNDAGEFVAAVGLVILLSPALFCIGVLGLLIGAAIRVLQVQSRGLAFVISGVLTTGMGILAIVVPPMLPAGSGNTYVAWIEGLTVFLAGFPLTVLGPVLVLVGLSITARRSASSS
jgi:hypothetical protein